ncbi:MAG: 3D domain-containing protein [Saccharofermentanales bacterium]
MMVRKSKIMAVLALSLVISSLFTMTLTAATNMPVAAVHVMTESADHTEATTSKAAPLTPLMAAELEEFAFNFNRDGSTLASEPIPLAELNLIARRDAGTATGVEIPAGPTDAETEEQILVAVGLLAIAPKPTPTLAPTPKPTAKPTPKPTRKPTPKPTPKPTVTKDAEGRTLLGSFSLTAYCSCYKCCGKQPGSPGYGITASGQKVQEGVTIAADTRVIPMGSRVYIEGVGERIVQDRGGAIKGNRIDIYFASHSNALKFGRKTRKVYLIK